MSGRKVDSPGMEERSRRLLPRIEAQSYRRGRLVCICTGATSLVLILVTFVLQVVEGSLFPVLTTAAAFVLQVRFPSARRNFSNERVLRDSFTAVVEGLIH